MKSKMFFVAAAAAVITLSSCKKDYDCDCEYEIQGESVTGYALIEDSKKKDAEDECDSFEADLNSIGSSASCDLSEK